MGQKTELKPYFEVKKYAAMLEAIYAERSKIYSNLAFIADRSVLIDLNHREDYLVRLLRVQKRFMNKIIDELPQNFKSIITIYFTEVLDQQKTFLDKEKEFIEGNIEVEEYATAAEEIKDELKKHFTSFEELLQTEKKADKRVKKLAEMLKTYLISTPIFVELFLICIVLWNTIEDKNWTLEAMLGKHESLITYIKFCVIADLIIATELVARTERLAVGVFNRLVLLVRG